MNFTKISLQSYYIENSLKTTHVNWVDWLSKHSERNIVYTTDFSNYSLSVEVDDGWVAQPLGGVYGGDDYEITCNSIMFLEE